MPLAQYINHRTPFGPIDASIVRPSDAKSLGELFDRNNAIYEALKRQPPIVMGRKGSGKTSYLRSAYLAADYSEIVELKTAETFIKVIRAIEQTVQATYFVEAIAELWETLFFCSVFAELVRKYGRTSRDLDLIRDYLAKIGVRDERTLDDVLWTIVDTLAERLKSSPYGLVAEVLRKTAGVDFKEARAAAARFMHDGGKRAIILLDSLDEYSLDTEAVSRSLAGLLMCVGRFNAVEDRIDIRFCLPSELYHQFMQVCASPAKTFQNTLLITWHARELITIGAHRLRIYLREFHPELFDRQRLDRLDPDIHADAKSLLYRMLPETVVNKMGLVEDSLAYILRHTQLLPRHFLMHLNKIADKGGFARRPNDPKVGAKEVVAAVYETEEALSQEIFSAYRSIYPNAMRVCLRCVPELPFEFSLGDLQRVFNRHGKKAMGTDEFADFKTMLIEIGAVGQVIDNTDRYIVGRFEYTLPHRLVTGTDDRLCLHPLILKTFNARPPARGKAARTVYPFGSDIDGSEFRGWAVAA